MGIEDQLRDRLRKAEALFVGGATPGERAAAGAAVERIKARLKETARAEPTEVLQFSLPDSWSVKLFVALCRRYGFSPFRQPKQRRTTLMVRAPRRQFDQLVWRPFLQLHADLEVYLEATTEKLIHDAIFTDATDLDATL